VDHLVLGRGPCHSRTHQPCHADEQERDPGLEEERHLRYRRAGSSGPLL
jgi:hypothetical protein